MQALSTLLVATATTLAAMLAGHLALSRSQDRGLAVAFMLAFAVQSGLLLVQLLQPGLLPTGLRAATGSALPVLLYLFFAHDLENAGAWRSRDAAHGLPVLGVILLVTLPGPGWRIDAALLLIELGYAMALLSSDRRDVGNAWRRQVRLAAAGFLLAMAACDLWIGWELAGGANPGRAVSMTVTLVASVISVAALFVVAWRDPEWLVRLRDTARESASASVPASLPAPLPSECAEAERQICARLDDLFRSERSYAEFGLSLDDVARKLGVSSRELSAAVNRIHGRGFRSVLNDYRVEDAARQLVDVRLAHKSITDVMFDAGFQTKSNFNKEFAARRSLPPGLYRKRHGVPEQSAHGTEPAHER